MAGVQTRHRGPIGNKRSQEPYPQHPSHILIQSAITLDGIFGFLRVIKAIPVILVWATRVSYRSMGGGTGQFKYALLTLTHDTTISPPVFRAPLRFDQHVQINKFLFCPLFTLKSEFWTPSISCKTQALAIFSLEFPIVQDIFCNN